MSYKRLDENANPEPILDEKPAPETLSLESDSYKLKVLCKEKAHNITNINSKSTVAQLKNVIFTEVGISVDCQRLIFNGKLLNEDNKTIESYGVHSDGVIHLFPRLPIANSTPSNTPPNTVVVSAENVNPMHDYGPTSGSTFGAPTATFSNPLARPHMAAWHQYDANVSRSGEDVKAWSYLLLLTSSFRFFGIVSSIIATGAFGVNPLDSVVQFCELMCSIQGFYVSRLGIMSVQSLDLAIIRKYVMALAILACVAILVRFVWVADVILIADQARRDQTKPDQRAGATDDFTSGISNGDSNGQNGSNNNAINSGLIDKQAVILFGMQAALIAAIIAAIWMSCVVRAIRFQRSIEAIQAPPQATPATATSIQEVPA